jgi:hypothetical protein
LKNENHPAQFKQSCKVRLSNYGTGLAPGVAAHLIRKAAWRDPTSFYRRPAELAHDLRQATRCASIPAALQFARHWTFRGNALDHHT